jgi:hypothetical protein
MPVSLLPSSLVIRERSIMVDMDKIKKIRNSSAKSATGILVK